VRVALADPPAFTPQYDHALATALGEAGAVVTLLTSHFRFGESPPAVVYARDESFYRVSSRVFGRSRVRLPFRAAEHLASLRKLARVDADVLHVQWLAWPEMDARRRFFAPAVFTAHDVLPRRTAERLDLWRRLFAKFDRVISHSEHGRRVLAGLDVDARVIPHPVFPADVPRADDGRTALALGVLRPYKGLPDAVEATRRAGARLLVAGDPLGSNVPPQPHAEARLAYLPDDEIDRALSETTVALFPYRPEIDQSGALLRALGAGVPAVAYDAAGIAEPVARYGAGLVVAAGDVQGLAEALRTVLADPAPFRAGAERARAELTWAASARAHLELYGELA